MKRKIFNTWVLAALAVIYLFIFAVAKSNAQDFVFDLREVYDRPAIDVNKPSIPGYDQTCAHAATANSIAFITGADQDFAAGLYFALVQDIGNKPSRLEDVWDAVMDAADIPMGFGRYSAITHMDKRINRPWEDLITSMLNAGWVVLLGVDVPELNTKHVITVYGYTYEEDFTKTRLLYCDSDDRLSGIVVGDVIRSKSGDSLFKFSDGNVYKIFGFYAIQVRDKVK